MDCRVRKLEADSQQMMSDIKTLDERVSNHGTELDELKIKSATMDTVLTRIDATVAKIDGRMDAQQMKPAQRLGRLGEAGNHARGCRSDRRNPASAGLQ